MRNKSWLIFLLIIGILLTLPGCVQSNEQTVPPDLKPSVITGNDVLGAALFPIVYPVTLEKYDGMIYHAFFHSLIVYPELAFAKNNPQAEGYNMWMTTVSEFKLMLEELYKNDFILFDIESAITVNEDGTITQNELMLPAGKKPLVISVDDVNYYDYMKGSGFAARLLLDENGDVATEVEAPDGTVSITYDGDVVPILDAFVKKHPDFSHQGAKGVLAVTGYQGALGYRITDLTGDDLTEAQGIVTDLSARLRNTGWKFASHSYTHNQYFNKGTITMAQMQSEITRWNELIGPYVGGTSIFIAPFGVHFKNSDERYRLLIESGISVYCGVGGSMSTIYYGDNMMQDRLNLDGYTMLKAPERIEKHFFKVADVIDPLRPPLR